MIEDIDFNKSIDSGKIKWKGIDFIGHYALLAPFFGVAVVIITHIDRFTTGLFQLIFWVSLGLSYGIIRATRNADKLIEVVYHSDNPQLRAMLKLKLEVEGWRIHRNNSRYITAEKHGKWLAGSKIALLFHGHSIWINVQNVEGFKGYAPFSFGQNKRIREEIELYIISLNI